MASSTAQARKTKTLPLQTYGSPQDGHPREDETSARVIHEGEIVEEEGRSAGRARRRPADRRRAPESAAARLRREVDAAGEKYMAELRRADLLAAGKAPKERAAQLTGIHKSYVSMMVLSCLQPLTDGFTAKSVLSMVGMGSAMWMLSPNFRHQVGDFRDQMAEAVSAKIDERRQSRIDKVIAEAAEKGADGVPLSRKWQARLDQAERAQRGGRDAYTAQSAGMTEVALAENAYAAMREEGADIEAIRAAHSSMVEGLYEQAREDGLDPEEVARAARVVVGLRLEEEPGLASVFSELAHGQFARSAPREVRLSGTDETAMVWTGEFESRLGQQVRSGSFGLRGPMDADQHQAAIADTMTADMVSLTRRLGASGLNMDVISYAAAWGLRGRADYPEMAAADNHLGKRLRTSALMWATMDADGISAEEQQRIYSNAYVDALENVSALYPEAEHEWAAKFGANWRENMRSFVSDPHSYMNAYADDPAGASATAWEAGPAGPSGKYRNARINQNYISTETGALTGFGSDSSDFRDQDFGMGE